MLTLLTIYGISIDCPNLISMAQGLNVDTQQPAIWSSLQTDCCTASGITCVSQRVTAIVWHSLGLDGTLSGEFPATLQILRLYLNQITGSVPTNLPSTLTELTVCQNLLTGTLPNLPSGLTILNIHSNKISGNVPVLPSSLQIIHLGFTSWTGNEFTGTLTVFQPKTLNVNYNWFTEIVIANTSLLTSCDLSSNPLLGSTNVPNYTMCTKNNLYSVNLPTLYDGQPIGCGRDSNRKYRYHCGTYRYYPSPAIAGSWDRFWNSLPMDIDCRKLTEGPPMEFNTDIAPQGQPVYCGATPPRYRYSCGSLRFYPDPTIASSWDAHWGTERILINCTGIPSGPDMALRNGNEVDGCPFQCPKSSTFFTQTSTGKTISKSISTSTFQVLKLTQSTTIQQSLATSTLQALKLTQSSTTTFTQQTTTLVLMLSTSSNTLVTELSVQRNILEATDQNLQIPISSTTPSVEHSVYTLKLSLPSQLSSRKEKGGKKFTTVDGVGLHSALQSTEILLSSSITIALVYVRCVIDFLILIQVIRLLQAPFRRDFRKILGLKIRDTNLAFQ